MTRYKSSLNLNQDRTFIAWTRAEKKRWLVTLMIGTAAAYATRTSLPLLLPAISKERNWSKKESGALLSAFFWGYTLTQVIGGYLSDKYGGLKVIFVSAVGWSLLTFSMPFSIKFIEDPTQSVHFIILIRVLNGAFQGVHFPSMISLTSQKLPEMERPSFFSAVTAGSAIGTLFSGILGSYVLENFGWPIVFYMLGSIALLWALFLRYQMLKSEYKDTSSVPLPEKQNRSFPWLRLLRRQPFWACVTAHACQMNCFFVMMSWLPTYFHDNFPDQKRWVVNMVPWLFLLPCTLIAKALSERLLCSGRSTTDTRKIIESVCFIAQISGLAGLAGSHGSFGAALFCSGLIIGAAGFHNTAVAVNAQDLAPRHSGTAFGIVNTLGTIPGFLGVLLAGHLLHSYHSWPVLFRITAGFDLIGWAAFVIYGSAEPIV